MPNEVHATSTIQRCPVSVLYLSWFSEGTIKQLHLGWGMWTCSSPLDHRNLTKVTEPLSFVDFISSLLTSKCHTKNVCVVYSFLLTSFYHFLLVEIWYFPTKMCLYLEIRFPLTQLLRFNYT